LQSREKILLREEKPVFNCGTGAEPADTNAREISNAPEFNAVVRKPEVVASLRLPARQSSQVPYRSEFQDFRRKQREQTDKGIFNKSRYSRYRSAGLIEQESDKFFGS
jgi:hypothetical protein